MPRLVQSRIGRRIALSIGLAMTLLGVGGLSVLLASVARTQEDGAKRLLGTAAEAISAAYNAYDQRHEQHPVAEIVAELSKRDELSQLDVFDAHGRTRWSLMPRQRGQRVDADIWDAVKGRTATVALSASGNPQVVLPLRKRQSCLPCHASDPDPLGGIHLAVQHRKLYSVPLGLGWQAAAVLTVLVALVTGLLLFLVDRSVLAPLGSLVSVMSKAEEGDFFVRAEVKTNDEIGLLASTFNKLLAKITDLRVAGIESERELSGVRDELGLAARLTEKSQELEEVNRRLHRRITQLSFLYDLGRELASEVGTEALLDRFSSLVRERLGVPQLAIVLLEQGKTRVVAARGFGGDEHVVPTEQTNITDEAIASNSPIYVPDLSRDPRAVDGGNRGGTGSLFVVPVTHENRIIGALIFGSPQKAAFSEDERELYAAISQQAAWRIAVKA